MSATLSNDVIALLNDAATTKIIATVDADGAPHAVVRDDLQLGDDGNLHLPEYLESSATNRNLLGSLWFNRGVAVTLHGRGGRSVRIKGRPVKTHITGPLFLRHYRRVQETHADIDLAAVWVIEPDEVQDTDLAFLKAQQDVERPTLVHLNRLLKQGEHA